MEDPTKISSSQERHVKKHVKDFFEKAVTRKKERDEKETKKQVNGGLAGASGGVDASTTAKQDEESDGDQRMDLSDDEAENAEPEAVTPNVPTTPATPANQLINGDRLKRKREGVEENNGDLVEDVESTPSKRLRSETPPPPPPPPVDSDVVATSSSGFSNIPATTVDADTSEQHGMGDEAAHQSDLPRPPPTSYIDYTEDDQSRAIHQSNRLATMFDGMKRNSPSDGDGTDTDRGNGPIDGLGIRQMRELEVHHGH